MCVLSRVNLRSDFRLGRKSKFLSCQSKLIRRPLKNMLNSFVFVSLHPRPASKSIGLYILAESPFANLERDLLIGNPWHTFTAQCFVDKRLVCHSDSLAAHDRDSPGILCSHRLIIYYFLFSGFNRVVEKIHASLGI